MDKSYQVRDERGNLVSFDQLYDSYFHNIFGYILNRVANVAEAEDLTSQTFFKALENLWRFQWSSGSFSSWLYRIATNEVNSHFRKKSRVSYLDDSSQSLLQGNLSSSELETAEQELARHSLFLDLNKAIQELKPEEQSLIVLRFFEQKSYAEIAEIIRKRQGTVTMRTHRALEKLKKVLEKRGISYEKIRGSFDEPEEAEYRSGRVQARFAP